MICDPQPLLDAANAFDARAAQLATMQAALRSRAAAAIWRGPAADRWRDQVRQQDPQCARNEERLRAAAASLRRAANDLEQRANLIRHIEERISALFGSATPGLPPPWQGSPWSPGNLPPTGDSGWLRVARDMQHLIPT